MTNSDVALLQRELHRLSDQVLDLSREVRDYGVRLHDAEAADTGRLIADDEIAAFKDSVRRWIIGSIAAAGTIVTVVVTLLDRLNA
jgi:hypothetical protein